MNDEVMDILLVEDSEDDAALFMHAFRELNPDVRLKIARDGAEALAHIYGTGDPYHAFPISLPKLIILDLKMPKISGIEVLRRIKSNPYTRAFPVVALSSSQEKRDLVECYQLGVNSYLVKPMDFDEFGEVVGMIGRYWLNFNSPPKI